MIGKCIFLMHSITDTADNHLVAYIHSHGNAKFWQVSSDNKGVIFFSHPSSRHSFPCPLNSARE